MSRSAPSDDDGAIGVGPHPEPWPTDPNLDPELLENGDYRNVLDCYRYWSVDAIVEDLDSRRHGFHVAIENWEHDFNIGTVVRNANAFLAAHVHVIGERRWDRLLFGQEGPGLSEQALAASAMTCEITQYGSTRSMNAGVASGIAMFAWALQHAERE